MHEHQRHEPTPAGQWHMGRGADVERYPQVALLDAQCGIVRDVRSRERPPGPNFVLELRTEIGVAVPALEVGRTVDIVPHQDDAFAVALIFGISDTIGAEVLADGLAGR